MATFCVRPNGMLQYDLCLHGRRFRETSGLRDTPENRRRVKRDLRRINAELETQTFDYGAWFPSSRKAAQARRWVRDQGAIDPDCRFADYAQQWLALHVGDWKRSYATRVQGVLRGHLIPRFGDWPVDQISERAVRAYRQELIDWHHGDGDRVLSNARINFILTPLSGVLRFAERECGFPNPMRNLRPLRDDRNDPMPLTAEEVAAFLDAADPGFRLYFEMRFYTGLRSCEINGLKAGYVDLERRRIRVREAIVDGRQTTLKHPKTRRDVPLSSRMVTELEAHMAGKAADDYVFVRDDGRPLAPSWVSEHHWKPVLEALGLAPRRVYQTRHTAAVLHLAAGENPLFVSRLLGHSSTKMLFERYAPFVANVLAWDGTAFEAMMETARARLPASESVATEGGLVA